MPLGGHSLVEIQTVGQSYRVVALHFTEAAEVASESLGSTRLCWLLESSSLPSDAPAQQAWPWARPTCSSLLRCAAGIAASAPEPLPSVDSGFGGRRTFWTEGLISSSFFASSVGYRHRVIVSVVRGQSHASGCRSRTTTAGNSWWLPSRWLEKSYKLSLRFEN